MPPPAWIIFKDNFFHTKYSYFASRVLFSASWRRFFFYIIVRSHSFTHRPATPTSDWFVVWIEKTQRGPITNRSCHLKIYPTSRTIRGVETESPPGLARTTVPSHPTFSKAPWLDPHHQMQFNVIPKTLNDFKNYFPTLIILLNIIYSFVDNYMVLSIAIKY